MNCAKTADGREQKKNWWNTWSGGSLVNSQWLEVSGILFLKFIQHGAVKDLFACLFVLILFFPGSSPESLDFMHSTQICWPTSKQVSRGLLIIYKTNNATTGRNAYSDQMADMFQKKLVTVPYIISYFLILANYSLGHTTCLHRFSFLPNQVEGMGILFEQARTKFTETEKSLWVC